MNNIFIKSIYQTIVEGNNEMYKQLFNETKLFDYFESVNLGSLFDS